MNDNQVLPLVSFCILTYNQEKYIEDAVKAAFAQEYENLEIIISDDCSTDKTYDIAKNLVKEYKGSHKVILNRNEPNLGIREHCNKVLYDLAKGDFILLAGGDDVSAPERTSTYVDSFLKYPQVTSISCLSEEVDEQLNVIEGFDTDWDGSSSIFTLNDYCQFNDFIIYSGDSRGLRRNVIENFPRLKYSNSEDIYLFFRSLLIGSGCFIRKPLVKRRHHGKNESQKKSTTESLKKLRMQLDNDLEFAYNNQFISAKKNILARNKIRSLTNYFELYTTSCFYSFKTFFYRVLLKFFKVKKI